MTESETDTRFLAPFALLDQPPLSLRMRDHVWGNFGRDLVRWVQNRLANEGADWHLSAHDPNTFRPLIESAGAQCGYPKALVWCWFLCAWHYDPSAKGTGYLPMVWKLVTQSEWLPEITEPVPDVGVAARLCATAAALQDLSTYGQFFIPPKEAQKLFKASGEAVPLRTINECYRALEASGRWERVLGGPRKGYCWYVYRGPELTGAAMVA